jgi:hypothetical protein
MDEGQSSRAASPSPNPQEDASPLRPDTEGDVVKKGGTASSTEASDRQLPETQERQPPPSQENDTNMDIDAPAQQPVDDRPSELVSEEVVKADDGAQADVEMTSDNASAEPEPAPAGPSQPDNAASPGPGDEDLREPCSPGQLDQISNAGPPRDDLQEIEDARHAKTVVTEVHVVSSFDIEYCD